MAQSNTETAYCSLNVFCAGPSQELSVSWEEWSQSFQLIIIAMEEIDIDDLLRDNLLPKNFYPTLEEARGDAEKRLKSKLFQSLGKQGQRYFD